MNRNSARVPGLPCCSVPVWGSGLFSTVLPNPFHTLSHLPQPIPRLRRPFLNPSGPPFSIGAHIRGACTVLYLCHSLTTSSEQDTESCFTNIRGRYSEIKPTSIGTLLLMR